jgi:hypothetical protein
MISRETQSAFAARCGVNKGTVTRWKASGRLVLAEDGLVDIDASIQRLEATRGVRHDVADRWRAYREAQGSTKQPQPAAQTAADTDPVDSDSQPGETAAAMDLDEIGRRTRVAQMLKEEAIARQKQREDDELAGRLIRRDAVKKDTADACAIIAGAWENLPDRMAPVLVGQTDQERIRALLRDEVDAMAREVAEQLGAIGEQPQQTEE